MTRPQLLAVTAVTLRGHVRAVACQRAGRRTAGGRRRPDDRQRVSGPGQRHPVDRPGRRRVTSANVVVQASDDAVVVVDSGRGDQADQYVAAIRRISRKPIRFIINTQAALDHVGGNETLARSGRPFGGRAAGAGFLLPDQNSGATIIAHEKVLNALSAPSRQPPVPQAAWPSETYFTDDQELFNGEAIQMFHVSAITDGDTIVFFRRSDVICSGDVFSTLTYPKIDVRAGGGIAAEIAALNQILDLAVPRDKQEGGTYIVPGHGRVADEADVLEYRDMVVYHPGPRAGSRQEGPVTRGDQGGESVVRLRSPLLGARLDGRTIRGGRVRVADGSGSNAEEADAPQSAANFATITRSAFDNNVRSRAGTDSRDRQQPLAEPLLRRGGTTGTRRSPGTRSLARRCSRRAYPDRCAEPVSDAAGAGEHGDFHTAVTGRVREHASERVPASLRTRLAMGVDSYLSLSRFLR